jgi:hypothetical protein
MLVAAVAAADHRPLPARLVVEFLHRVLPPPPIGAALSTAIFGRTFREVTGQSYRSFRAHGPDSDVRAAVFGDAAARGHDARRLEAFEAVLEARRDAVGVFAEAQAARARDRRLQAAGGDRQSRTPGKNPRAALHLMAFRKAAKAAMH